MKGDAVARLEVPGEDLVFRTAGLDVRHGLEGGMRALVRTMIDELARGEELTPEVRARDELR